jgi:hypothetical protein
MGLTAGEGGIKQLVDGDTCPTATARFQNLEEAVDALGMARETTYTLEDGNVAMMGTPSSANTFAELVEFVVATISKSSRYSRVVIFHIDEPDHVPPTKHETQRRRDAASSKRRKKGGVPLSGAQEGPVSNPTGVPEGPVTLEIPMDDNYTHDQLVACQKCRALILNRATRYRLFDAVCTSAFQNLLQMGVEVIFDGVDPRGAERPVGEPRKPDLLFSALSSGVSDVAAALKGDGVTKVGESDLKLRLAASRLSRLPIDSPIRPTEILIRTIDTDMLPILLLTPDRLAPPTVEGQTPYEETRVFLCMRERGAYAEEKLRLAYGVVAATEPSAPAPNATEDANVSTCNAPLGSTERVPLIPDRSMGAGWLLVDVARLRADLHAFAPNFAQPLLPYTQPEQVLLRTIATVWALSGCDFVDQVAGVGQVLTSAATTTLDQNIGLADLLKNLLHDDTSSLNATPVVREIVERGVEFLKGRPRTGKRLRETADTTIHRAIWTMLYWANPGAHPKDYEIFGFPSMEQQETVPTTTAIGEGATTTV